MYNSSPLYETYDLASHQQPFISSPGQSEAVRTLPYMTPRYSNTAPVDTEETLLLKRVHDSFVDSVFRDDQFDNYMATLRKAVQDGVIFEDNYGALKAEYDRYLISKNKIYNLRAQIINMTPEQYGATLGSLMYEYNRTVVSLNMYLTELDSQTSVTALQQRCRNGNFCSTGSGPCVIKEGRCDYRYNQQEFDDYFKRK